MKDYVVSHHLYFRLDGGDNVHATTKSSDYMYFFPKEESLTLAGNTTTKSFGYGVILLQLHVSLPPTPLAPVYYCPNSSHGIISLPALRHYNKIPMVTLHALTSLVIQYSRKSPQLSIPSTQRNLLDYLYFPLYKWKTTRHLTFPSIH